MIIVKTVLVVCKNQSLRSSCVPVKSDQYHSYCLSQHFDRYICATPIFKTLYVAELVTVSHPSSLVSAILICCQIFDKVSVAELAAWSHPCSLIRVIAISRLQPVSVAECVTWSHLCNIIGILVIHYLIFTF